MVTIVLICLSIVFFSSCHGGNQNTDFISFLNGTEYTTYNKKIFPRTAQSDQVVVSMKYSLIAINKMDGTEGQIQLVGFFDASWTNDHLKSWTADINEMVIAQDNFWLPPITLHNTVETLKTFGDRSNKLRINKDGTHKWKIGLVSATSCVVKMSHYPFDKHTCSLQFTPWGYQEDQLKLENSTADIDLKFFTENVQWFIEDTSVQQNTINGASYLTYSLTVTRRPGNTLINYALPVLVLSILSSLAYMMPAESGERISFSVVAFMSLVIYITTIADNIPRSSYPITIFSLFLTLMLVMNALLIAMAALTLRVYSQEEATEIPVWIKHVGFFLKCQNGKKCCKRKKIKRSDSDGMFEDESDDDDDDESTMEENLDWDEMEWRDIGNILDWTFFILFILTTLLIAIFFYVPLALANS